MCRAAQSSVVISNNMWPFKFQFCCLLLKSCLTLLQPMDCSLPGWDFPGKNTEVGCHFLLQGIFLPQGWNSHPLHWQVDSLL